MAKEFIYDIVRSPVITEKSSGAGEQNKVTLKVSADATKTHVKQAVETLFNVKVEKVNIINVKGKVKRFRGIIGKRSGYKKAIVSIAEGQSIDMTSGV